MLAATAFGDPLNQCISVDAPPPPFKKKQGTPVACAAAGAEHSVVATQDGRVFSFGWGKYGCLGDGTREDRCAAGCGIFWHCLLCEKGEF